MTMQLFPSNFSVGGKPPLHPLLSFPDTVLRGIGQVMLQNNRYAGLLFLIGIFYNSWLFGVGVLVGTAASTATALLLAVDREQVRQGLFGYNGALIAIGLLYFLHPNVLTWICVVFAGACSTVVMAAMLVLFRVWKLPVLTAPFVFTSLCFFLAVTQFAGLQPTHLLPTAVLPHKVMVQGVVTLATVGVGLCKGIAQVFFQDNVVTGIFFAVGLLISSRLAFAVALMGSLVGLLVAWGMGAAEPAIRVGAFGFNSVLTSIAVGSVFFALNRVTIVYTVFAAAATAVVVAAVSSAFEPLGVPALTLPFVLVTWGFVLAGAPFARLRVASRG